MSTEWMTTGRAADHMGVCQQTVLNMVKDGRLHAWRHGGRWRVSAQAVAEYLDRKREQAERRAKIKPKPERPQMTMEWKNEIAMSQDTLSSVRFLARAAGISETDALSELVRRGFHLGHVYDKARIGMFPEEQN